MAIQTKEEKSKLTSRLVQLIGTYDYVIQELKEAKSQNIFACTNNTEVIQELKGQLETKSTQLAK